MKTQIKVGTYKSDYPIKKLKQSLVNRDIVKNHCDLFSKKIAEFGWLSPIIIDDKGNIIEGHHRALSAENLGLETIPVYIINWVDTNNLNEYQKTIISLNNSNRKWNSLDYLKSFARTNTKYKSVLKKYYATKDVFSVGNLINIYFNSGCNSIYRDGNSKFSDKKFSDYLFKNLYELKNKYKSKAFTAYTINQVCSFANSKIKGNEKEMKYILKELEVLAMEKSPMLTSIEMIRPWLNKKIELYRTLNK